MLMKTKRMRMTRRNKQPIGSAIINYSTLDLDIHTDFNVTVVESIYKRGVSS